ncbi:MAG TPA: purine-nucleoside phosphorylase [Bacteroidota bacterium]|nr:purine-nucleoside phosphorylase [Bacteroidota bacterium]
MVDKAVSFLTSQVTQRPAIAVVLGSGLGDFAEHVSDAIEVRADTIPGYPVSSVVGHDGKLIFGTIRAGGRSSLPLLVFKGRVHFYESGDLKTATFPISVAAALGVRYLLATNAAGGINPAFSEGELMLIEDHINFTFLHPHLSDQRSDPTPFHTASSSPLHKEMKKYIHEAAGALGMSLRSGTYCWLKGPSYETKAEIEMLRRLGADAVGMSTVPELILATELGMKVGAVSLISNMAAGLSKGPLSHEEVSETATRVKEVFKSLLEETILRIKD